MISRLHGVLLKQDMDSVEVETAGGVVYEVHVPATVAGRLPPAGSQVRLRTVQVVRDDSVALYGFLEVHERDMFQRLLGTTGVGAKLAREMLSTYSARRLAQALANKETAVLTRVSGVGKKTAELLILRLGDKVRDLALAQADGEAAPHGAREAVNALMALGYSFAQADKAVRAVKAGGGAGEEMKTEELIRRALERIGR
ncbi:MAG: Holliday junction branch migration protein RuvA [Gammaproteobacteria bacterium]|nr:Holliday junction branch migration protein RuvA [Gammaproteobacteria bacterium]MYC53237.1 Holliday junction branch migration protein RuvA [Gammaproteobacteria bacterium]